MSFNITWSCGHLGYYSSSYFCSLLCTLNHVFHFFDRDCALPELPSIIAHNRFFCKYYVSVLVSILLLSAISPGEE